LLAAGDSTLYLVWAQLFDPGTNDGEETPDSLLVETSVDRGASWRRIPSLGFRDGLADIDAAVDGVGALHVAAMTVQSTGDRAEIVFARWAGDNWSVGEKVRNAAPPLTLSAVSVDSVFATWTALRSSGGRQIPVTVLSKRGPCRSQ
jgi:hypothetical protein